MDIGTKDCPYTSLQMAIDNAKANDSIIIEPGQYFESVVINKDLVIVYVNETERGIWYLHTALHYH
jgi:pectin methylesterase-like acyl-CoA thioesterase